MIDSVFKVKKEKKRNRFPKNELESVLFSKGKKINKFFTNDSGLYYNCDDWLALKSIESRDKNLFDSLNYKVVKQYNNVRGSRGDYLYLQYCLFAEKIKKYQDNLVERKYVFLNSISIFRLWNASILGAIIIGMISMSFIYRYLGPGVSAKDDSNKEVAKTVLVEKENKNEWSKEKEEKYLSEIAEYLKIEADRDFNIKAKELVKGYPIAEMMPYIIEKDPKVAAFYIAIAKKESNWGKRVPVLNGKDCYNYVGYRGKSEKKGSGGHTCFNSRKEAVDVVSKRIKELIEKYDRDTAKKMVVWKCGNNCAATGGQAAANKWIDDVDYILEKLGED